ncbi:MAG TPA: MFS transporter [archaeon]|mgnify:CR=1 FL=1|jgi:MFS family permease|nr:MFS transporter [archaeon]HRT02545.1 MFS transporter [Candidatus Diapherotrites archaeon]
MFDSQKYGYFPILQKPSSKLMFVTFVVSIGLAIFNTVYSLFLENLINNPSQVGLITALLTLVVFFSYVFLTQLFSKYPTKKVWIYCTLLTVAILVLLFFFNNIYWFIVLCCLYFMATTVQWENTAVLLRGTTSLENIQRTEEHFYGFNNIGWMVGPFIASIVIFNLNIKYNFLIAGAAFFISYLFFLIFKIDSYKHDIEFKTAYTKQLDLTDVFFNIKTYFLNKENIRLFVLRGGLYIYWSVIYIFMPLLILESGLSTYMIGVFLGSVMIPLILFELFINKRFVNLNIKSFFIIGYSIIALCSILAFVFSYNMRLSLFFMILTGIGAAFIEPTTEAYFFKLTRSVDVPLYYGIYKTSESVFNIIARLSLSVLLVYFTLNYVYLFLAIFMLIILFITFGIENIKTGQTIFGHFNF